MNNMNRVESEAESIFFRLGVLPAIDEVFGAYTTEDNPYVEYNCIARKGSTDLAGAIEDTLHRLIDAGASSPELMITMGVIEPKNIDNDNFLSVNLGYYLPGNFLSYREVGQDDKGRYDGEYYHGLIKIDIPDIAPWDAAELRDHLIMNGYDVVYYKDDTLYAQYENLYEIETIMDDRELSFAVDKEWLEGRNKALYDLCFENKDNV